MYLDESGFEQDMPRTHGYAPKGEYCYGKHDWHARGRVNAMGALIGKKLLTVHLFKCNINSDVFHVWITQGLIPELPPHSVIVLDNATFHKRMDAEQALLDAGHTLLFLPPYSPDLNPIEKKWAQLKAIRKQLRCSVLSLFKHVL